MSSSVLVSSLPNITDNLANTFITIHTRAEHSLGGEVKVEAGVEPVQTQLPLEVVKAGWLCLLRLSKGLLRLLEGLGGEGWLEGLLLRLASLLELEGGVWLLLLGLEG